MPNPPGLTPIGAGSSARSSAAKRAMQSSREGRRRGFGLDSAQNPVCGVEPGNDGARGGVSAQPHCQMFPGELAKRNGTPDGECSRIQGGNRSVSCVGRGDVIEMRRGLPPASDACAEPLRSRALVLPQAAWGQAAATLPEVTVTASRPPSAPTRRPARAATPATSHAARPVPTPVRESPALQVVSPTPVTGIGFDRNKVPAMVQTLTADDFTRTYSPNVVDALVQRIPGVVTSDAQGNELRSGSALSRLHRLAGAGHPAGARGLHEGVRVNEAFGDTVNWDLIPTIAIGRADVWTNNPAFGLNALGGAISFQMKDGFTYQGLEFDASGGSYGRVGGSVQYGVRKGEWALYLAAQGLKDDGWRYQSPSRLARFYGDLGWKGTDAEVHLVDSARRQLFRRGRADAARTAQQRLSGDLHLAADHQQPGATSRAQRPLFRDRPLDGPEQSLLSQVPAGACRRQRSRGRALQRQCGQPAVQHAVPAR